MKNIFYLLFTVTILLWVPFNVSAKEIRIITEEAPPASYQCGSGLCGLNVDIVKEIIKRLGWTSKIELLPWKRGFHELSSQNNVILFSTAYTEERSNKFQWCGPLNLVQYVFMKSADSTIAITTMEDAKGLKIGTYADDIREKILLKAGFDASYFTHYHGSNVHLQNLKMLLSGRVDLWITSDITAIETFQRLKASCENSNEGVCKRIINKKYEELIEIAYIVEKYYLYAAFSKGMPSETVKKWQQTLDQIKADGTYERIMSRYQIGKSTMTYDKPFN